MPRRTRALPALASPCSRRFAPLLTSLLDLLDLANDEPSRAISRCNSAETFGGSAEPSGVCSVARGSAAPRLRGGRPAQGWFEVAKAQPGEGPLHSVDDARAFPDQALALPIRPLGVLFGNGRDARMVQWPRSPRSHPKNPRFSNSVSSRSVLARRCSRDTATLEGWITCASTPRARSQRANQKPSRRLRRPAQSA